MKNTLFSLSLIALVSWAISVWAEPAAPFLPYNDMGKKLLSSQGKTPTDAQKEAPTKEQVGMPIYPGSYLGTTGGSSGELSSVQFVSKDSADKVIAWYQKNLGKGWKQAPQLTVSQIGEVGVFVKTDLEQFDDFEAMKMQQIRIAKVEKPEDTGFLAMAFDVTGVKSIINMQIKPLM